MTMRRVFLNTLAGTLAASFALLLVASGHAQPLAPTNEGVPFCYRPGSTVRWPILTVPQLRNDEQLVASLSGEAARPLPISREGLRISVEGDRLVVASDGRAEASLKLKLNVRRAGASVQSQTLTLFPAPPDRPISYISDLVDDLIRVLYDNGSQTFRPVEKHHFDAYFRRLQAHGVRRLIVWQSPFPITTHPDNFAPQDWERYRAQASAIIENAELTAGMRQTSQLKAYQWIKMLMAMRLNPNAGRWYTQSAREHEIRLTASFRPFEMALMKYYQVPTFDEEGNYLWQFLPQASPAVNYHASEVGFAHYREILKQMGREEAGQVRSIEIGGVQGAARLLARHRQGKRDIGIYAAGSPPLDESSFVLIRKRDGTFVLQTYESVKLQVQSKWRPLNYKLRKGEAGQLVVDLPAEVPGQYLIVTALSEEGAWLRWPVIDSLTINSAAGNRINRLNYWISQKGDKPAARATRVAGIPADGEYRTEFQAVEESIDYFRHRLTVLWSLAHADLVLDLGEPWSTEMVDFQRLAARQFAVRQLKSILAHDAFDEILLNTRSHTQLAGSFGEGGDGPRTLAHYRLIGRHYAGLSIDRVYAPIALSGVREIKEFTTDKSAIEHLTMWQYAEWQNTCQDPDTPFKWRFERNRAIADGVRQLLVDLEREFPNTRIRAVIPQSAKVDNATRDKLKTLQRPNSKPYGADYFQHVWGTGNHIPAIGEGMTMVDLRGLRTEPTYLGIRYLPETEPLELFLTECDADLRNNRGSSYQGPKSIVYEAQATLRHDDQEMATRRRQEIIQQMLRRKDIDEVLLYEAIDWLYSLPLDGSDPYAFLD